MPSTHKTRRLRAYAGYLKVVQAFRASPQALKPQAPRSLNLKSRDVISAAPPFIRRLRDTAFIQP
jgi:hypothetical protein